MGDDRIRPELIDRVPLCSERCPSHDGKRCEILGQRPGNICEPAVCEMVDRLDTQKAALEEIWRAAAPDVTPTGRNERGRLDHIADLVEAALATRADGEGGR